MKRPSVVEDQINAWLDCVGSATIVQMETVVTAVTEKPNDGTYPCTPVPSPVAPDTAVEALQEAAFFVIDGPAPTPEGRNFRQHVFEGDQGE